MRKWGGNDNRYPPPKSQCTLGSNVRKGVVIKWFKTQQLLRIFSCPKPFRGWVWGFRSSISRRHVAIYPHSRPFSWEQIFEIIMKNIGKFISPNSFDKRSERCFCTLCCPWAGSRPPSTLNNSVSGVYGISWTHISKLFKLATQMEDKLKTTLSGSSTAHTGVDLCS